MLALGESLRERLIAGVPGLTLHDHGRRRCGIVTFTVDGTDPFTLAAALRDESVNISVSTIDFARFDFEARDLTAVARASVHYYNTDDELDRFVAAVARIAAGAGSRSGAAAHEAAPHEATRDRAPDRDTEREREQSRRASAAAAATRARRGSPSRSSAAGPSRAP